jgi:hypothetical protein
MPNPIAIAGILAIVVVGLAFVVLRILGKRPHELNMLMRQNHSTIWLAEKSLEERHEERRDYLRERAKNDRH